MSEEKKEAAASGGAGGPKLMVILTAVNTVVCLAMVGILFVSLQKEKSVQKVEDIVAEEGHGEAAAGGGHGAPAAGGGHGAPAAGGGHGAPAAGGGHGEAGKKVAGFGKMMNLDQFTVNLTTPGSSTPKYVRVNISIEVPDDAVESEVSQKMAQVRNAIIDLFNSKRPSDLVHSEGRDYLKEEIRAALNGFIVSGKVKGVFFTNFALSS
jgi:flagellar basal body-associated protein FliL